MSVDSAARADHILTYARTLAGGGVERAQLRLAADWLAAGRRVSLVLGSADGPLAAELPPDLNLILLGSSERRALLTLPRHVRALRPDILFCPGSYYTSIAAWARLRLGRAAPPIVAKLSNAVRRRDLGAIAAIGERLWLARQRAFVDHLVAMSPASAREARLAMRLPPERVSIIPNPPARHVADPAPPALPDRPFLLGIGRLEPQKRWDRAIAALARLGAADARLLILGEGGERARLEALARRLGVAGRVLMPGHVLDPTPAIRAAAAVVLTSDYEGVPGVLREALAQGAPVVATESSLAVREIVSAPSLGTVVPPDDADALVAALDHWLAPGRARPAPVPEPGADSGAAYLALFDRLIASRNPPVRAELVEAPFC